MTNLSEKYAGFRSGFVMLGGAPNVGKSTLLNRMLGEKISITSEKAQTTRNRILGILHRPKSQLIFLDTPGVHRAKSELNVRMVDTALSSMSEADLIVFITDLTRPDPDAEKIIVEKLQKQTRPVILVLNKTDLVKKNTILPVMERWSAAYPFRAVIPISAISGDMVDVLLDEMEKVLPEGPPLFPEDAITDMPERFIVGEMVREKVFRLTGQEIPYSTAVTVESFSETEKLVTIHATIHVEKDSQKGIIIGKQGQKLRQIGEAARKDIERMLGVQVFLKLFVRVEKNWSRDTKSLRKFGY
ncbi:MAG: GTPase Era [Desulfobacterales bacterium]